MSVVPFPVVEPQTFYVLIERRDGELIPSGERGYPLEHSIVTEDLPSVARQYAQLPDNWKPDYFVASVATTSSFRVGDSGHIQKDRLGESSFFVVQPEFSRPVSRTSHRGRLVERGSLHDCVSSHRVLTELGFEGLPPSAYRIHRVADSGSHGLYGVRVHLLDEDLPSVASFEPSILEAAETL